MRAQLALVLAACGSSSPGPTRAPVPVEVAHAAAPEPAPTDPAIDVVAWERMGCAALESGVVKCWGNGEALHQLPWRDVVQLGAGEWDLLCARHRDGSVDCTEDAPAKFAPKQLAGPGEAAQIAVAEDALCVLRHTGTVGCWVAGGPARLKTVPGVTGATAIAISQVHGAWFPFDYAVEYACAIVSGGRVPCWQLYRKQIYDKNTEDLTTGMGQYKGAAHDTTMTSVVVTRGVADATAIAGAPRDWNIDPNLPAEEREGRLCIRRDAKLACGRMTDHGLVDLRPADGVTAQDGDCTARGDDVTCGGMWTDGLLPAVHIDKLDRAAAGAQHACAIAEGRVWCWGKGSQGALGPGNDDRDRDTPVRVPL
jgi:hypothetical protein